MGWTDTLLRDFDTSGVLCHGRILFLNQVKKIVLWNTSIWIGICFLLEHEISHFRVSLTLGVWAEKFAVILMSFLLYMIYFFKWRFQSLGFLFESV